VEDQREPKDHYAFKCMGGVNNGVDMIEPMRGSGERAFIACTVDLLEKGVDIERLNAVVFLRYPKSTIKFYQMVGRGTRKVRNRRRRREKVSVRPSFSERTFTARNRSYRTTGERCRRIARI
jgi:type I site-specific restriction endonuclease